VTVPGEEHRRVVSVPGTETIVDLPLEARRDGLALRQESPLQAAWVEAWDSVSGWRVYRAGDVLPVKDGRIHLRRRDPAGRDVCLAPAVVTPHGPGWELHRSFVTDVGTGSGTSPSAVFGVAAEGAGLLRVVYLSGEGWLRVVARDTGDVVLPLALLTEHSAALWPLDLTAGEGADYLDVYMWAAAGTMDVEIAMEVPPPGAPRKELDRPNVAEVDEGAAGTVSCGAPVPRLASQIAAGVHVDTLAGADLTGTVHVAHCPAAGTVREHQVAAPSVPTGGLPDSVRVTAAEELAGEVAWVQVVSSGGGWSGAMQIQAGK